LWSQRLIEYDFLFFWFRGDNTFIHLQLIILGMVSRESMLLTFPWDL
jgi:hypothetical protein